VKAKKIAFYGIIVGALLALGPVWSIGITALSMIRAFQALGQTGVSDPRHLALDVGNSLMVTSFGFVLCPFGLVLLGISIFFFTRKAISTPPPLPLNESAKNG